jgi:diacylglycerol kinase
MSVPVMSEPPTADLPPPQVRSWATKFRDAFHGLLQGVHRQSSFTVHFLCATAVVALGGALHVGWIEWSLLAAAIMLVLTAEMFNSALEAMARAITGQFSPHLKSALNIGSAAVLLAAIGAATIALLVFGHRLAELTGWW